jgi:F0F1-type ATP synthase membrane subunit b/b'
MSDMLEKLLGVEKNAAALLSEAEAEAARRKADARAGAQKKHAELVKGKTQEGDAAVAAEKVRIAAEKERLVGAYKERLAGLPRNLEAFSRAALAFVQKGGA